MTESSITVAPANGASEADLDTLFDKGDPGKCQCQRFKIGNADWTPQPREERAAALRTQSHCGETTSPTTGLVAYVDREPVGWCAVEPRVNYPRLLTSRSPVYWKGRDEDPADEGVWAVTCFVTRKGFRNRGISAALVAAVPDYARSRGARAVEGYPMLTEPGKEITWGELFVGSVNSFADAGFVEVSAPTLRRRVMRIDF
jgi:GNAT superfamily N-acetyltransferase